MKTHLIIFVLLLMQYMGLAQAFIYHSYDFQSKVFDTLPEVYFDTTIIHDKSVNYMGDFSAIVSDFPTELPIDNVFEGSQWTRKVDVLHFHDISDYPIRAIAKSFEIKEDTLKHNCSGIMISERHMLTSSHCFAKQDITDASGLYYDSLIVCLGYHHGVVNPISGCSNVKKAYFPLEWNLYTKDVGVLELEEPLGKETGWLSIGYNNNEDFFLENIFHKFSYPGRYIPFLDSFAYNGDTMYYSYGGVDLFDDYTLGIEHAVGIPGESGSALIHVDDEGVPTSYGVLNFSNDLTHIRITSKHFYPIIEIIRNDINKIQPEYTVEVSVYPNPTSDKIYINSASEIVSMNLYDITGRLVSTGEENSMSMSNFVSGTYFLLVNTDKGQVVKKVVRR